MLRRHRITAAIAALAVASLLVGCAGSTEEQHAEASDADAQSVPLAELDILDDPHDWSGETTAILASSSVGSVITSPKQTLPVTVTSHDLSGDTEVVVDDTSRILGLDMSGSVAATIVGLGLGDALVGRDVSSTFDEVADLPVVTSGGHSINSESVIALRPSVIITDGTIGPNDVVLQLRDTGIPVVFVDAEPGFGGVGELARQVGTALGASEAGEALAAQLEQDIAAKVAEIASIAPSDADKKMRMLFLYLRGSSGIYYLFGSESGVDDLITGIGGIDVATEIGWSGMQPMTDEAIIAARPDLILVMTSGLASTGGVDELLATKLALAQTPAGANRRFVDMADGQILSFGPRTPAVLDALARAVYAPGS